MKFHTNQRGVALVAVLGVVLILLPIVAAVCLQARLDALVQRNYLGSTQAFYAAEFGLVHAFTEIQPTTSFADLLAGPDGIDGTADDGWFPFRSPQPAELPYEVRASVLAPHMLRLRSIGHGIHGAIRELELTVTPSDTPFTPAAFYIEAARVELDLGEGGFSISGAPDGGAPGNAVAGIAVTSNKVATSLRDSVPPRQAAGAGGSPSIVTAAPVAVDLYSAALRQRPDAIVYTSTPTASQSFGTAAAPRLCVVDVDWKITDDFEGFGILVVRGGLEVRARFHYRGWVVVDGELRSTPQSDVRIEGTVWLRDAVRANIDLRGTGFIRYDPKRLNRTAAAIEGALPYLPEAAGWREIS